MLILASQSPRRKELLSRLTRSFRVEIPNVDETKLLHKVPPHLLPIEESKLKARAIVSRFPNDRIIACDTIVYVDGEILGKPKDEEEAFKMLSFQSGKRQEVISGYTYYDGKTYFSGSDITYVYFKTLSDVEIRDYIRDYRPFDKAGAYGIQDEAGLIDHIEGSYSNVMGFPLEKIKELIQ